MQGGNGQIRPSGFSREHLEEHYRLYPAVHLSKMKEIEARLLKVNTAFADSTYSPLRSLKREYAYALNSVRMHALFFENIMEGEESQPTPEMTRLLERYFGSVQEWEKQFYALAMCSRGWVILGFDLTEGILNNFFADNHSEGVWTVMPIMVLDVFEHAYCTAFPSRSVYIKNFLECIDWKIAGERLNIANEMYKSMCKIK